MDVAHGEMVERQLDALIQRRARKGDVDPEEAEEIWQESVRRYNARRREELDLERYEYHRAQAVRLRAVLESLIREHEQNAEKHLPKGARDEQAQIDQEVEEAAPDERQEGRPDR